LKPFSPDTRLVVVGPLSPAYPQGVASAANVRIDVNRGSGKQTQTGYAAILEPNPAGRHVHAPEPRLDVVIDTPSKEWPPPDGEHVTATVTYSDVRDAGRWRKSISVDLHRPERDPESEAVSFRNFTETDETQVTPPPHTGTSDSRSSAPIVVWFRAVTRR
jgi:hypothetical protein